MSNGAAIGIKYDDDFGDGVTIPAIAAVCTAVRTSLGPVVPCIDGSVRVITARVYNQGMEDWPLHQYQVLRIDREQGGLRKASGRAQEVREDIRTA